jgi:anti-anti-sigma regulatory factor
VGKTGGDDDDLFSLDFTKISMDDEPAVEPPPAEAAPTLDFSSPAPVKAATTPPAVAGPATENASAFETFTAPLELLDFSAMALEPLHATEAPAPAPVAAVPEAPKTPAKPPKKATTQPSVLLDIARQHAAGKTAEASNALEAVLRAGTLAKATEQGWGMLFDLLQILNRRQAFENLADAYAKRFERSAPAWLDATGEADSSLDTGGAAYVALSGILSASSEGALKKLVVIAESNPTVRLGLLKVTDAGNDGCRLLLESLRAIKKGGRECLLTGADEFAAMLANKVEMMKREREETWLLLLELYQRAGNQLAFEDTAIAYAVTFEVSPPSWEAPVAAKTSAAKPAVKGKDPFVLEGELLAGMNSIATLAAAAKGKDAITIETDNLARIDEVSVKILLDTLTPLHEQGLHIRIRGANLLVATLLSASGLDKIAKIETRRR